MTQFNLSNVKLTIKHDDFLYHRKEWIDQFNNPSQYYSYYKSSDSPEKLIDDPNWIPNSKKLEILSDWIKIDHCWLKTIINGNPDDINDRRIFIEKTPRVFDPSLGLIISDWRSWISGDKGDADEGEGPDLESIKWSEEFAKFIGYK